MKSNVVIDKIKTILGLVKLSLKQDIINDDCNPFYLISYKVDDSLKEKENDFEMPRHGDAKKPTASLYYRQDPCVNSFIDEKVKEGHSTEKIYVSLINEENTSLLETIKNPKTINNRKQTLKNSNINENDDTDAESIIKYIKRDVAFTKSFQLNKEEYTAFNFDPFQFSDIVRFCVHDTAILSVDTTFEIYDGLYFTDTSYENLALKDNETISYPYFPGPSIWHFRKDQQSYRRFAGKILIAEPALAGINKVGHGLDKAIAGGNFTTALYSE